MVALTSTSVIVVLLSMGCLCSAMVDRMLEPTVGQTTVMPPDDSVDATEVMMPDESSMVTEIMPRDGAAAATEAMPTAIPDHVSPVAAAPLDLSRLAELSGMTGFTGLTGLSGINSLVDIVEAMAERLRRETTAAGPQAAQFKKLMRLMQAAELQDCAGRVICDLNCDSEPFAADGKRVLQTLARVQSSGLIERKDMEFYVKAGILGRKTAGTGSCHEVCMAAYPVCPAQSKDLIAVASLIRLRV